MRNPGGKGLSQRHQVGFRQARRDRRAAEKPQLKPACSTEEPPPWSPKESPSPPGLGFTEEWGWARNCRDKRPPSLPGEKGLLSTHYRWYDFQGKAMLKNTFLHVPGLGIKTEQRIWSAGVHSWNDLLRGELSWFSPIRRDIVKRSIEDSIEYLSRRNANFFGDRLPSNQFWRLFPEFRVSTAYLDIETTGLDSGTNEITTIALYDGKSIFTYVQGQNLEEFREDIRRYKVIVTYNGRCFDIPFIGSYLRIQMTQVHIDLRYLLKSLGYTGGLKGCEKRAGIDRGDLEGLDGYFAVLLWDDYQRNKNQKALETLLAYNIQDVVNLETLMVLSYNLKLRDTPFMGSHQLALPSYPEIALKGDAETIARIKYERFIC
jgi:hypothetical protein